jgi:hypothetical protein
VLVEATARGELDAPPDQGHDRHRETDVRDEDDEEYCAQQTVARKSLMPRRHRDCHVAGYEEYTDRHSGQHQSRMPDAITPADRPKGGNHQDRDHDVQDCIDVWEKLDHAWADDCSWDAS